VTHKATHSGQDEARIKEVAKGQKPFAAILSCVDSRVPPEIVFDQGLGDLFTARVAAGIANDDSIGSVEFGVEEFKIPLVVVMGHQRCGAVVATVEAVEKNVTSVPGEIGKLVTAIKPAVQATAGKAGDHVDNAVRETTRQAVAQLLKSPILSEKIAAKELMIVGAYYSLDSGAVEYL
jgi:carbonic anhydrase